LPSVARRIIAVSADEELGQQLAQALQAAGSVEVHRAVDGLPSDAALVVLHVEDLRGARAAIERLPALPVIVVSRRPDLVAVVELMQALDRVAGVIVRDDLDGDQLLGMAIRATSAEMGLERVIVRGARIHTHEIGDYEDKLEGIGRAISHFEQKKVPAHHLDPIEQCLDEMVMNALFNAAVDANGQRVFAGVPTRKRVDLRTQKTVTLQYAADANRCAVAVRDSYGSLDRETMLRSLYKGLHAEDKVDRKAGGAGLGLYLMVNSASAVHFHVVPGVTSEVTCVFDIGAQKLQLEQLGFNTVAAAGLQPTGPARKQLSVAARRRRIGHAIAGAAAAALLTTAVMTVSGASPHQLVIETRPGATIEIDGRIAGVATDGTLIAHDLDDDIVHRVTARHAGHVSRAARVRTRALPALAELPLDAVATVQIESEPPDAKVLIDGVVHGTTPLVLTELAPATTLSVTLDKPGYRRATATLEVPKRGQVNRVVQQLALAADLVRVRLVSNPSGAEVLRPEQASAVDRTYTPADVFVPANQPQRFMLVMPKHEPLAVEFAVDGTAQGAVHGGDLKAVP
jgi:hypothetical protein